MDSHSSSEAIDQDRRHLLGIATLAFAATPFGKIGAAQAQSAGSAVSFAALKQVDAGVLNDNPDHVAIVIHNYRWRLAWRRVRRGTTISSNGWRTHR
jgi:hypothetical protein